MNAVLEKEEPMAGSFGHIINSQGIPEKCPNTACGSKKLEVEVRNYSAIWHDGDVCCTTCGTKIRSYDAG